ncbi:retrovirus-related Pol polyprotein LINE-1 [Elysia marginata]|uniref:Retrovirus-related Pol polyprotein LINE-1 n=1 Tax=Elysia marginata TaxID=1093978 RepID=A0AAV4GL67_9GAST|nr:retrovirus-related Pol polyprotein LINE-1 [Elysia marginata]
MNKKKMMMMIIMMVKMTIVMLMVMMMMMMMIDDDDDDDDNHGGGRDKQTKNIPKTERQAEKSKILQRKLKWYGHATRSSGLAKTIIQGTVNGDRTRGRQNKRWADIREWTGLELINTLRIAEDREEWKAGVRRSSTAPRRIPNHSKG